MSQTIRTCIRCKVNNQFPTHHPCSKYFYEDDLTRGAINYLIVPTHYESSSAMGYRATDYTNTQALCVKCIKNFRFFGIKIGAPVPNLTGGFYITNSDLTRLKGYLNEHYYG